MSFGTLRVLLGAALLLAAGAPGRGEEIALQVTQTAAKTYAVHGQFAVPASASLVWGVLTDYQGITRYVSSIKRSRVVKRVEDQVWLEQAAEAKVWMFSVGLSVSLIVREIPSKVIEFRDAARKDFKRYEGSWELRDHQGLAVVTYRLEALPALPVPEFLSEAVLKANVEDLLKQVRLEIIRRAEVATRGDSVR